MITGVDCPYEAFHLQWLNPYFKTVPDQLICPQICDDARKHLDGTTGHRTDRLLHVLAPGHIGFDRVTPVTFEGVYTVDEEWSDS